MKQKYLGLMCLLYVFIILFVSRYNILRNFLAPGMQIYLKASIIPLLVIGLIILFSEEINFKFVFTDVILLLPLIMLILAGDGRLTTSFARNRTTTSKQTTQKNNEIADEEENDIEETENNKESDYDFSNPNFDIIDEEYYDLANYLTYNPNSVKYAGKTIRVRGFIQDSGNNLPNGLFGLGKYGVSCCAADAGFVGFLINPGKNKVKINSWYEVEGVFQVEKDLANFDILTIKVINIKNIDSKDEELYIYPCYSYGDSSCKSILKYNLEY